MQGEKREVLEVSGQDADEAIANGLDQLGLSRNEVFIEVLDRGRRGVLGLGAEPAQVRILYPAEAEEAKEEEEPQAQEEEIAPQEKPPLPPTREETLVAKATVEELLEKMGIQAQVTAREPQGDQPLTLDISGEGIDSLLDPQGKTLNALQYIARLIVSRELLHWVTFFLDAEGFRERRAEELRGLARRVAERVALSGQPLALKPMPAHERRIIHIALRDHPLVTTESVGQREHRRVTILPRE
ncbi:MAG: RNA-binding cell elongation regulator Jag/EloR [Chloroflexota bacterium]|nr:RNA-binding cell elongation regulator Jag/EloR [Chloroflexota bacterium]